MGISHPSLKRKGFHWIRSRTTGTRDGTSPDCGDWANRLARFSTGLALLSIVGCLAPAQSGNTAAGIYRKAAPSVFVISVRNATGSALSFGTGFLIGKNTLVTNLHVVEGGDVFLEQGAVRIPASVE